MLQPHLEEGRPLRPLAIKAGISYRTAQRWLRQYQRSGLAALVRKKRIDIGVGRTVPVKIKAAIEGLALETPRALEHGAGGAQHMACARHTPDPKEAKRLLDELTA